MSNGRLKLMWGSLFVAAAMLVFGGCGSGPDTHEVKGTVTFDGQPVPEGQIVFESNSTVGAEIKEGKFTAQVPSGKQKVRITATREEGVAPDGLPNFVSYIPAKYNEQTTLEEDVTGPKEVKYDLTK